MMRGSTWDTMPAACVALIVQYPPARYQQYVGVTESA